MAGSSDVPQATDLEALRGAAHDLANESNSGSDACFAALEEIARLRALVGRRPGFDLGREALVMRRLLEAMEALKLAGADAADPRLSAHCGEALGAVRKAVKRWGEVMVEATDAE